MDSIEVAMNIVSNATGHIHKLFEYTGDEDAEFVVVVVGSAALVVKDTLPILQEHRAKYGKIGMC